MKPLPYGYLCEWDKDSNHFYFGEPGSAIEDDWMKSPVIKNMPLYSEGTFNELLAQLTTLTAKLEAAEKDARRYRAMRDDAIKSGDYSNPEEFDAVYDAALAQNGKE